MKQFLTALIFLMACMLAHQSFSMGAKPVPKKVEVVVLPEIVVAEHKVKIDIVSLTGFSKVQEERFRKIVSNTEKVINSNDFKAAIEGWKFKGQNKFHDTEDSPTAVYKKITSEDWKLEYRLEKLFSSKTIGYTLPSVKWIVFNSKKWEKLTDADISGNICHEYGGHKLGRYNHSQKWNADRPFSAPYGIGDTCKKLFGR